MPPRRKKGKNTVEALALAFPASSQGFPALPLDILFEIFSLVHPLDLLHLTRTTKPFRRFLLNRANVAIWRSAFATCNNEGGPPGCPTYMCEPAWARVAFEKTCHICFAKLRENPVVDSVWWEFGARYCGDCLSSQVSRTVSAKFKRLDPSINWPELFPRVARGMYQKGWYYLVADQHELLDAYTKAESDAVRDVLIHERQERTDLIMEHSKLCRSWATNQIQNRIVEANKRRVEKVEREAAKQSARLQTIAAKLAALGWSDEPWMSGGTLRQHIELYPSVAVPKGLTPRAYRELEPALLLRLNAEKHVWIQKQRFRVFETAFPSIISEPELAELALSVSPRRIDIVLLPAVRSLLEVEGEAPVVVDDLVKSLRPILPALLKAWSEEAMTQIVGHIRQLLNEGEKTTNLSQQTDPLALAVAYMACPHRCGVAGHLPNMLRHCCGVSRRHYLHKSSWSLGYGSSDPETYQSIAEKIFREQRFTPTVLGFGNRLHVLMGVVRAYGCDPKTTTFGEMVGERRLVKCQLCVAELRYARNLGPDDKVVVDSLDWVAAMEHGMKTHRHDDEIVWKFSNKLKASDVHV
ncbi:hypothetical protein B0H11DRAFT_1957751 [Mycena galericulata]|nr:hypothetical protein B0H11DRAFT_1957751 [Mycena galericulata]